VLHDGSEETQSGFGGKAMSPLLSQAVNSGPLMIVGAAVVNDAAKIGELIE
jgi:hypothetical protein